MKKNLDSVSIPLCLQDSFSFLQLDDRVFTDVDSSI